jgi:hypothetical protein
MIHKSIDWKPIRAIVFFAIWMQSNDGWARPIEVELSDPTSDITLPRETYDSKTEIIMGNPVEVVQVRGLSYLPGWRMLDGALRSIPIEFAKDAESGKFEARVWVRNEGQAIADDKWTLVSPGGDLKVLYLHIQEKKEGHSSFVARASLFFPFGIVTNGTAYQGSVTYSNLAKSFKGRFELDYYRGFDEVDRALGIGFTGEVGYQLNQYVNFSPLYGGAIHFDYRNLVHFDSTRTATLTPQFTAQYESFPVLSSFVSTGIITGSSLVYEVKTINVLWLTLGARARFGKKQWFEVTPAVSMSAWAQGSLAISGGSYTLSGYKAAVSGLTPLTQHWVAGFEVLYLSLIGNGNVTNVQGSLQVGYQF